jgi:hypothetical protein
VNGRPTFLFPCIATLVRRLPVRLVDASQAGCRLESERRIEAGSCGQLVVELEGRLRVQDVRVVRCQPREGAGGAYQVGAELLRTRRLTDRSVRMGLRRFIGEAVTSQDPDGAVIAPSARNRVGQRNAAVSRAPPVRADPG